jgi:asparagine synthase (glutamine-hydrolysing)
MSAVLRHRGPDSAGAHVGKGVGLAIQRLAVIDLKTGDQPIFNEDRSVTVVLNGEIYNYRELREDLRRSGHAFATESDTEVIAHLYEDHGLACVRRLRGMFAFALWDARRERLVLARDRIGKKPLFYSMAGGSIWFGSEIKAILQDPDVARNVNFDAIDSFLHYQYVPAPATAFAGIQRLPPAHVLSWHHGEATIDRYWKLSYEGGPRPGDLASQAEGLRDELLEATRLRLRSDVPLGAFLSGGLDSSAVVAAMARVATGTINTFSIGFDVAGYDERGYAREVAQWYATDHNELRVDPNVVDLLPKLVWHYGEPFADHSALPTFQLCELARQRMTVALTGDGGDENFAGYRRYVAVALTERLARLPRSLLGRVTELLGAIISVGGRRERVVNAQRLLAAAQQPPIRRYADWVAFFDDAERRSLYAPELRDAAGSQWLSTLEDPFAASDATTVVERLLDVDVNSYLPDDLLVKMDVASMAYGLEVRSPMLDHRLMEFAARLPLQSKLGVLQSKRVLREAVRDWLPPSVLRRGKRGFSVPLSDWLRGELRDLPAEVLLDPGSLSRGYFEEQSIRRLISEHRARRADHANKLWALIQFELWHQMWIDAVAPI